MSNKSINISVNTKIGICSTHCSGVDTGYQVLQIPVLLRADK